MANASSFHIRSTHVHKLQLNILYVNFFVSLEFQSYYSTCYADYDNHITAGAYNRKIDKRLAHKLVWLRETNFWPEMDAMTIDHATVNGVL